MYPDVHPVSYKQSERMIRNEQSGARAYSLTFRTTITNWIFSNDRVWITLSSVLRKIKTKIWRAGPSLCSAVLRYKNQKRWVNDLKEIKTDVKQETWTKATTVNRLVEAIEQFPRHPQMPTTTFNIRWPLWNSFWIIWPRNFRWNELIWSKSAAMATGKYFRSFCPLCKIVWNRWEFFFTLSLIQSSVFIQRIPFVRDRFTG